MKTYPVADHIPGEVMRKAGFTTVDEAMKNKHCIRAVRTPELRPPLKGEWYLSGAEVAAYRAPNDLSTPYLIARLVKTEIRTTVTTSIAQAL